MIFSVISATFSLCLALSHRLKHEHMKNAQYHYRTKKVFKMKIESQKFQSYHRYTHKMLTKSICSVLNIDNIGYIEVFYIVSARNALNVFIQVTQGMDIDITQLADGASGTYNGVFKQEIDEKLGLKIGASAEGSDIQNRIRIAVVKDKTAMGYDVGQITQSVVTVTHSESTRA